MHRALLATALALLTAGTGCATSPRPAPATAGGVTPAADVRVAAESYEAPAAASFPAPSVAPSTRANAAPAPARAGYAGAKTAAPGLPPTASASGAAPTTTARDPAQAPLVIYAGSLTLAEGDARVAVTLDRAIDAAEALGGYLAARRDDGVTVRVPSPSFREALRRLEALGTVLHRNVTATDVTEEMHDGEVRLQNLRATRARLQEFLARAANVTDALAVERELERVAMEIDRLEGRLQYLTAHVAYSQIDLSVVARPAAIVTPGTRPRVDLPFAWLGQLGAERLLSLH